MSHEVLYILISGDILTALKGSGLNTSHESAVASGDNWVIIGPVGNCAVYRFKNSGDWRCFETLEEARAVSLTII